MTKNYWEMAAFIVYLMLVLGIGIFFFIRGRKQTGDKAYFLGGRQMNGFVAALSAGASDMSAWVLMGLPGSIYLVGMGKVWISVGLLIGTICAWIFIAPKLRKYSIKADDSITIPQFLTNRFKEKNPALQAVCAVIFIVVYCIYSASSISACGSLFNSIFGWDPLYAMIGATVIILLYTFLGGFNAVCWTDFFQGMLMLMALMAAPIVALIVMNKPGFVPLAEVETGANYYNVLTSGKFDYSSIADILSGLGWGLGYMGMPHILVRYMSIKSEKDMKRSQIIGSFVGADSAIVGIIYSMFVLAVSVFCLTSLDTATRLARYMFQEFWLAPDETVQTVKGTKKFLCNPYFATIVTVVLGVGLGMTGYAKIWPLFGAANQLLAAVGLLAVCTWLGKVGKNNKMFYIPMVFMLIVTISSLVQTIMGKIQAIGAGGADIWAYIQAILAALLIILALVLAVYSFVNLAKQKKQKA